LLKQKCAGGRIQDNSRTNHSVSCRYFQTSSTCRPWESSCRPVLTSTNMLTWRLLSYLSSAGLSVCLVSHQQVCLSVCLSSAGQFLLLVSLFSFSGLIFISINQLHLHTLKNVATVCNLCFNKDRWWNLEKFIQVKMNVLHVSTLLLVLSGKVHSHYFSLSSSIRKQLSIDWSVCFQTSPVCYERWRNWNTFRHSTVWDIFSADQPSRPGKLLECSLSLVFLSIRRVTNPLHLVYRTDQTCPLRTSCLWTWPSSTSLSSATLAATTSLIRFWKRRKKFSTSWIWISEFWVNLCSFVRNWSCVNCKW